MNSRTNPAAHRQALLHALSNEWDKSLQESVRLLAPGLTEKDKTTLHVLKTVFMTMLSGTHELIISVVGAQLADIKHQLTDLQERAGELEAKAYEMMHDLNDLAEARRQETVQTVDQWTDNSSAK